MAMESSCAMRVSRSIFSSRSKRTSAPVTMFTRPSKMSSSSGVKFGRPDRVERLQHAEALVAIDQRRADHGARDEAGLQVGGA